MFVYRVISRVQISCNPGDGCQNNFVATSMYARMRSQIIGARAIIMNYARTMERLKTEVKVTLVYANSNKRAPRLCRVLCERLPRLYGHMDRQCRGRTAMSTHTHAKPRMHVDMRITENNSWVEIFATS